jgi:molecular chaperone DnaK
LHIEEGVFALVFAALRTVAVTRRSGALGLAPRYTESRSFATRNLEAVELDVLNYTIGVGGDVEQPLINSMGIALANNEYDKLFERGRGLPLKETRDYRTIHPIKQGRTEDVFRIPVVEGENEKADRNRLNGALEIRGDMIRRDLPTGSEVEVTLKMDESRILTVSTYIPLLDEEFAAKIEMKRHQPNPDELRKDYEKELRRLREVKSKAAAAEVGETAERLVDEVESSPLAQEVTNLLAAAKADCDAAAECEKRLLKLKLELDKAAGCIGVAIYPICTSAWAALSGSVKVHATADLQPQHLSRTPD